jgi:uncharacterized membrane-anchored protein
VLAAIYYQTAISHVTLFWAAFILTRPLGATVGDFLDKPLAKGGLELSRPIATAALLIAMAMRRLERFLSGLRGGHDSCHFSVFCGSMSWSAVRG